MTLKHKQFVSRAIFATPHLTSITWTNFVSWFLSQECFYLFEWLKMHMSSPALLLASAKHTQRDPHLTSKSQRSRGSPCKHQWQVQDLISAGTRLRNASSGGLGAPKEMSACQVKFLSSMSRGIDGGGGSSLGGHPPYWAEKREHWETFVRVTEVRPGANSVPKSRLFCQRFSTF